MRKLHEWQMRLLGLKVSEEPRSRRGLILLQIDGLSFPDLEKAMKKGHMPFLSRLKRREHYRLWPLYSGVPSNTPSFQGEFFFGQTQCVPAFQFLNRSHEKVFTMYEKKSAGEVEKNLLRQNEGLLAGGSAYCNIFSGGAAESHVCASTADIGAVFKTWNPYSFLITLLLNPYPILRGLILCLFEGFLAWLDFFRGWAKGEDAYMEWMFIITRVFTSVMLREMVTTHVKMDIYRGLPVIQANFFGYDEQAHRRGPSTRFAYWSLSGIDAAIRRIWQTAMHAERRHYDVWIYSDHGQEKTIPFAKAAGKSIAQAIKETQEKIFPAISTPQVTTVGPIAQIYFHTSMSDEDKRNFAKQLLEEYPALPLIAVPLANGEAEYMTPKGTFHFPEDSKEVLGTGHPYREAVAADMECLLEHENCGDLVIFGWSSGYPAISFSNENGAHAGPGPSETQAFALLPPDAPMAKVSEEWIRTRDLRQAALVTTGKAKFERLLRSSSHEEGERKLRILSYNVHSCVGVDGVLSVDRIARVIAKSEPDVVALQEVDTGRRFKGQDQAAAIAAKLEMHFHFHAVCGMDGHCFGNAIFSRYPIKVIRAEPLPALKKSELFEPRGFLWVEMDFHGRPIQVITTHLSLWAPEQNLQIQKLLGPEMLGNPALNKDVVLCGDFNTTPGSRFYRMLAKQFKEPKFNHSKVSRNTWTSRWPVRRLDYIFVTENLQGVHLVLPKTRLESFASDHLPIAADLECGALRT